MTFKKTVRFLHLWLGLISGLLVFFLGMTGCILAFQREIEDLTQPYRFNTVQNTAQLAPTQLKRIADQALTGKKVHSIAYQSGRNAQVVYFDLVDAYYYIVFVNQYTGEVTKVKDMNADFFRFIINGHYYLWLPEHGGQLILTSATLIFVVLLISGLVLWWPKNKAASKKRFSIKWNAKWKRVNYDLHNVLGFYMTWVVIFIALSGMVMGFQWFANSVYFMSSGGKQLVPFEETYSAVNAKQPLPTNAAAADVLWQRYIKADPHF
uniref:PepSY-associated TM helix domain-containing protein n=1 Tax=Pedobacter sp. TaxID=1411316 RepID=UPI003D7F7369